MSIPATVELAPEVRAALESAPSVVIPESRNALYRLALGPNGGPRFTVNYDVNGSPFAEAP